jgi:hypothetical protein
VNWQDVGAQIAVLIKKAEANPGNSLFNDGQIRSLRAIAERLPHHGVIVADEVGMGKTRIAAAVAHAVILAGGRVAFLLPPGLGAQWAKELQQIGVRDVPEILRSLGGFLDAWSDDNSQTWFSRKSVLISHAFANWRLGQNSQTWRWALLPLTWAAWFHHEGSRRPWGIKGLLEQLGSGGCAVETAAGAIAGATATQIGNSAHSQLAKHVFKDFDWTAARTPDSYYQNSDYRSRLERIVGVGLGSFDLIVIDEAHKSRDDNSALSRLLEKIVIGSGDCRRVALTATPVELDIHQWIDMLKRINVPDEENQIRDTCRNYAEALESVRLTWRTSAENRSKFGKAAIRFQECLSPFVLRRDKREDEPIKSFMMRKGETIDSYRRELPIVIRPTELSPRWLDAVMAAEALSAISSADECVLSKDKRLRLTVANGHGISAMMDAVVEESETTAGTGAVDAKVPECTRSAYWRNVLRGVMGPRDDPSNESAGSVLYEHPAIIAAVEEIEGITAKGRKVLVFGRFTRPMKALEEILNARAMLRHLRDGKDWPQSAIRPGDEPAVDAAIAQMKLPFLSSRQEVATLLGKQHDTYEAGRKKNLARVHQVIERGQLRLNRRSQTALAGAVVDLLGAEDSAFSQSNISDAADRIVTSLCDDDMALEPDGEDDASPDQDDQIGRQRTELDDRIQEEYGIPRGNYARRMYGETRPHTRRNLQLKFNRERSFPHVLIAQSQVGREGLNLHEQCRDVVLLHPEWNPGVVEQQIGRVDRLGSRWCKDLDEWIRQGANGEPPRIEIRPVMFMGTYDEHNWSVLQRRWQLLRGQLHGIIVTGVEMRSSDEEGIKIAEDLNALAPRLSPL